MAKNSSNGKARREIAKDKAKVQEASANAGRKSASVHLDRALGQKSPQAKIDFLMGAARTVAREAGIDIGDSDAPAASTTAEPNKGVSKADAKRHATVEKVVAAHVESSGKPATHFSHARTLARKGDVDGLRAYLRDKLTSGTSIRGTCTADLIKALS